MLTEEDKEYYDNYFELFPLAGWKQLKEEVVSKISGIEKSNVRQGSTDLHLYNVGYIAALDFILNYDDYVGKVYDDIVTPEVLE